MIEFLNCFSLFSSKKIQHRTVNSNNKEISSQEQTFNLTTTQINALIDNKLKHFLDQQNDLFKQLEQDKELLEKKIETLSQVETHESSISSGASSNSIFTRQNSIITPSLSSTQLSSSVNSNSHSALILPHSIYDYESEMQKNAAASVITSTLSVVAAVSLAAASRASCNNLKQQNSEKNLENLL